MRHPLLPLFLDVVGLLSFAASQSCFYPNGQVSNDFPCSSDSGGVMCCPFQWQCLDNGLCYNPVANIMGRYTCTDRSWQSPGCPDFCTDSDSVIGDEAVLVCSDGQYCCDRNRLVGDCCNWPASNETFFTRNAGNVFATVVTSGVAQPTSFPGPSVPLLQSSDSPTASPSQLPPPSSQQPSSPPSTVDAQPSETSSPTPTTDDGQMVTSTLVSISSGSNGPHTTTITTVFTLIPTSDPTATPNPKSSNHVSVIAGVAVGIPLGVALIGAMLFIFCRRRRDSGSSIGSDSSIDEQPPRRFGPLSRLWKPSSEPVSETMLAGGSSEEKLAGAALPIGAVGATDFLDRQRPRPPSGFTSQPLRVHIPRGPDQISLVNNGQQQPTVSSPTAYVPNPRNSWSTAISPYSPLTPQAPPSPTSFWRHSGDSDGGWGSGWAALSVPHLDNFGPGGLSPVIEEPGFNLDAPVPSRRLSMTPGGRYIPVRTPSGIPSRPR